MIRFVLTLFLLMITQTTHAHEVRPALLDIRETVTNEYNVLWRAPLIRGEVLRVRPAFPTDCIVSENVREREILAQTERARLVCERALLGRAVTFRGLDASETDALTVFTPLDGTSSTLRATPEAPTLTLPTKPTAFATLVEYIRLGFTHIFEGPDHLAFVLGLLLLIRKWRPLVKAVTAFTVAHSITLGASVIGFAGLSPGAVESIIALSIVFLALEIVRGDPTTLAQRAPWIAAFAFGLLHGFGFAGALADIGLPDGQTPLALLGFNLGIEFGQLIFIAIASALILWPLSQIKMSKINLRDVFDKLAAYGLGSLAMAWTLTRLAGL